MQIEFYRVLQNDKVIAEQMSLETALLLIEALCHKYWREADRYTLEKMGYSEDTACEG